MNKTAIKNFAIWAREKIIADILYKAKMVGITSESIAEKLPQSTIDLHFYDIGTKDYAQISGREISQRSALVNAIREKEKNIGNYKEAFQYVIEEVAYTWFNRLIAIRFMEVNDYLPSGVRVLSSENNAKKEPDLVTNPFDTDIDFTIDEQDEILRLKDKNSFDELFRILFIKQCNKLHDILPELFEKTNDYTELLLTISYTDKDSIVYRLVHDIDENDFNIEKEGQVEIIGWMYQYYISKKHDEIVNIYKGIVKKEDIPATTQLFTTDWVVRYMVDNSLGRYWIERNPQSKLAEKLKFLVIPKNGEIVSIDEKINPTDITFFDPCMGSGHILVYAFDVFMEIYRECGYSDRDASLSILENNIFGMDIDKRAYQLAYFAVIMKARSYNRRILTKVISKNLTFIEESNSIDKVLYKSITKNEEYNRIGDYLVQIYKDAKEIGTLQTVEKQDYKGFWNYLNKIENNILNVDISLRNKIDDELSKMAQFTKQAEIMSRKFDIVCTNPPYLNKFGGQLKDFVIRNYKEYSGDLFSVFIYRNFNYCKIGGYSAFMTPFVWMFIKTHESLRRFIIESKEITTLVQMEYSAFEEATVPICSFILKNSNNEKKGLYFRLSDFKGGMEVQKQKVLDAISDKDCGYYYETDQSNFPKIPGSPIAYWASDTTLEIYSEKLLSETVDCKSGIMTGSDTFIKLWYEPSIKRIKFNCNKYEDMGNFKWFPLNSGGEYRKWSGNNFKVVNLWSNGKEIRENVQNYRLRDSRFYFKKGITWGRITSSKIAFRDVIKGSLFGDAGPIGFVDEEKEYVLGFLCSKVVKVLLQITNPTLNFQVRDIMNLPLVKDSKYYNNVKKMVLECVKFSKNDWDSFEISWDFKKHPLLCYSSDTISSAFDSWSQECDNRFNQLKANEEELNRIFIDIYGLQDELTPEVEDKDVTVRKADPKRDIKSLVSYAVGCMFGRYSLDVDGIAYAGGDWDNSKYDNFIPDVDNCIPITDEEYFEDDIVGLFSAWVKKVYGEDTLEENLNFIAKALGNKGKTSRETIRNYFLSDFIKDHIKIYQKRPIYWLFDSGKQNGFKALVYMHRWNADTIGNMRIEYLHRMQRVYEKEIDRMQEVIDNSHDNREISNATKRKERLIKQMQETKDYDVLVGHLANSRINIDLDDGVKVNYEKVQTSNGENMQILVKI